jgi:2-furoyl-CoA dehydrogenase large subunit
VSREPAPGAGWVGRPVPLKEDARLVAGRGRFVDDLGRARMLHAAMLRSPHAHARIVAIDTPRQSTPASSQSAGAGAAARSARSAPLIHHRGGTRLCLAVDARYVTTSRRGGAVGRATAENALGDPGGAGPCRGGGPEAAVGPNLSPLSAAQHQRGLARFHLRPVDEAMARADGVLRERFTIQRYASTPLETFGVIAEYDPGTDVFEFWTNDQRPGLTISVLAASLGVPQARVRLSCPDIGGAFGNKRRPAYLLICALLARKAGRPVKWIEDRIENLTALMHACNGIMDVELGYRADGTSRARVRDIREGRTSSP